MLADLATPRKGVHALRVLDFAVVDVVGTWLLAYAYSSGGWDALRRFACLMALSVWVHWVFGIETKLLTMMTKRK
jgi:hypothetical protein